MAAVLAVEVNGVSWPNPPINAGDELNYQQVVGFALENTDLKGADRDQTFRVRFDGGIGPGGKPINGRLLPKGAKSSVKVGDGTKFTVTPTKET